jgi:hypothetical protein
MARDLERHHHMVTDRLSHLSWVHLEHRPVMRAACSDHHVVGPVRQPLEESPQRSWIVRIEGGRAAGVDVERRVLEAHGITAGEDDLGTLGARFPGGFEPDAGAASDDDNGLSEKFRVAWRVSRSG